MGYYRVTDCNGLVMHEDGAKVWVEDEYPQTEVTVFKARMHQLMERERVFRETGLLIKDGGLQVSCTIVRCPRCEFQVARSTESAAMQVLAEHFGNQHLPEHLRRAPRGMAS